MHRARARSSFDAMHLWGTAGAAIALLSGTPVLAQDGAATGTGTIEQPEGESPGDFPDAPADAQDPVIIASDENLPPEGAEYNSAGERQISFAADILSEAS